MWEKTSGEKTRRFCIGFFVYTVWNTQLGVMQIYKGMWVFTWHRRSREKVGGALSVARVHPNIRVLADTGVRSHVCAQTHVCTGPSL